MGTSASTRRSRSTFRRRLAYAAVISCFAGEAAYALPTGPAVVNGQVSFSRQGSVLNVTNSPSSIINWQSFSIGASETTRFIQQSAASSVLNRVVGQDMSVLLGTLQSNGRVFLINPAGILIGQGARIDVGGFVASTLNITDQNFLAGKLNFSNQGVTAPTSAIQNFGAITTPEGGSVYLVAPSVENHGVITTPKGEVLLAAGNSVKLVDTGTPNVYVEITAPDNQALNLGSIIADSGRIGISAGLIILSIAQYVSKTET
ncbi:MAG: filamentous hemagglutinin N-terminal domain-containing protein, partial [Pseudomonadota bacterium]